MGCKKEEASTEDAAQKEDEKKEDKKKDELKNGVGPKEVNYHIYANGACDPEVKKAKEEKEAADKAAKAAEDDAKVKKAVDTWK